MGTYCSYARNSGNHHKEHHDTEHGFPPKDDDDLFRRLMLEISQAGLSFDTVLKRKKTIYRAFSSVKKVSGYTEKDIERLMQDDGIIKNRLKIQSAIINAKRILELQKAHGSFYNWLRLHHPKERDEWVRLFRDNFKFTGGEIVNEFLMSIGILEGAHDADCPIGKKIKPKFKKK